MKGFHLLILLLFLLSAACEDATETQAELTSKKIQADIRSKGANIQNIFVAEFYGSGASLVGTKYLFTSDGFIVVDNSAGQSVTYNLGEVKGYLISDDSLTLYF